MRNPLSTLRAALARRRDRAPLRSPGRPPLFEPLERRVLLSGTTFLTHGFTAASSDATAWVDEMAHQMAADTPGTNDVFVKVKVEDKSVADLGYKPLEITSIIASGAKLNDDSEVFISFDWSDVDAGVFGRSTADVGALAAKFLLANDLSSFSGGSSLPLTSRLADRPLHLLGHSRGASVAVETAKALVNAGVMIDQLTTLDPHPVNGFLGGDVLNYGDPAIKLPASGIKLVDNYWREDPSPDLLSWIFKPAGTALGRLIKSADFDGEELSGNAVKNFKLDEATLDGLSLFDPGYASEHSDVHLWYFGTVAGAGVDNGGGKSAPDSWYGGKNPARGAAGWALSRIAKEAAKSDSGGGTVSSGGTSGRTFSDYLEEYEHHTHSVTLPAGGGLVVTMGDPARSYNAVDPWIRIYGPDGALLAAGSDDFNEVVSLVAPSAGTYKIDLASLTGQSGKYNFGYATMPAIQNRAPVKSGFNYTGTLAAGGLEVFPIHGVAGGGMVATMGDHARSYNAVDPLIYIFGPDGTLLGSASDDFNSVRSVTATKTGTHYVVATSRSTTSSGEGKITVGAASTGAATVRDLVKSGFNYTGTLAAGGLEVFPIHGVAGGGMVATMGDHARSYNAVDPLIYIFGPDGTLLGSASDDFNSVRSVTATKTGTHYVVATSRSTTSSGEGKITVGAASTGAATVRDLVKSGFNYTGTLAAGGLEVFPIHGVAGGGIVATMGDHARSYNAVDPLIYIFGPDGTLLGSASDDFNSVRSVTATKTGTHYVVATSRSTTSSGEGKITVGAASVPTGHLAGPGNGKLIDDKTIHSTLEPGGVEVYSFSTAAGERIFVRAIDLANSYNAVDPYVQVYSPDGTLLSGSSDDFETRIDVQAKQSGVHYVVLSSRSGAGGGAYSIEAFIKPLNSDDAIDDGSAPQPQPNLDVSDPGHGSADFDANGSADIVWRKGNGQNTIMLMDGDNRMGWAALPTVAANWKLAGVTDMDGDGDPDLVWRDRAKGLNTILLMDGAEKQGWVGLPTVAANWDLGGVADLNGDGDADLLFRNPSTGENTIMVMDGTARKGWAALPKVATNWAIGGVSDMNGDGSVDVVWRDRAKGLNTIMLMDGLVRTGWTALPTVTGVWSLGGVGDFDGNGSPDLMFRNSATGVNTIMRMGGTTRMGWSTLPTVVPGWEPVI